MPVQLFEDKRVYDDRDAELNLIASRTKRSQWRHRRVGPPWVKFGRSVKYIGSDLNKWIEANRMATSEVA